MSPRPRFVADGLRLSVWTLLPSALAAAASILGLLAAGDPAAAAALRFWAVMSASVLAVLLIVKGIRDYRWGQSLEKARYDAVRELHNTLGPALDMMTELATMDPSEDIARRAQLEKIADLCCSALVMMTPQSAEVRAVVFEIQPNPGRLQSIARFGRRDVPRVFYFDDPAGAEILLYLEAADKGAELYSDIKKNAPTGYEGDRDRYRTFIRVPIWANNIVFGMITVDAPKRKSLVGGDKLLAELVAAELATAFAIAAPGDNA